MILYDFAVCVMVSIVLICTGEVCVLKIVNAYLRAKVVPLEQRMKASSRVMAETNWKRYGFSERRF